jgi:hypothetical protein
LLFLLISYLEKKAIDNNYKLGENPYKHPYRNIIPNNINNIINILKIFNIFIILFRNLNNIYIILIIFFIFIGKILNFYNKIKEK